jgi:glycosyltransferase involved in cell wall biosynthesis
MLQNPDIVIPCKNEINYISNLLEDLNSQYIPNVVDKLNVYIADANSTDGTLEIIELINPKLYNLNISVIEGGSVSVGRNNGFKKCTSEYVIFIDADVRLFDKSTILDTIIELRNKRLVTCKLKNYSNDWIASFMFNTYNIIHKLLILKYPFAIGAYFAVHRDDFEKFGMFNENSDNSEDFLFSQNYTPSQFSLLNSYIGQDNRRFKKMGYIGMAVHLTKNLIRYMINGRTEFTKKTNYWK